MWQKYRNKVNSVQKMRFIFQSKRVLAAEINVLPLKSKISGTQTCLLRPEAGNWGILPLKPTKVTLLL